MLSVGPIGPVILTIRTITVSAWLVVILAALPFGPEPPDDVSRLAVGVAVVGSVKFLLRQLQKPAHEFYMAGKEMGRREALLEQANAEQVVRLEDRRQLRSAVEGERAVGGGVVGSSKPAAMRDSAGRARLV